MVRLAVIIMKRMWNIRGTGGKMKCIKMRCAECLPCHGLRRVNLDMKAPFQPDPIKIRPYCMRYVLSYMCHMQVGPDTSGSDSASP